MTPEERARDMVRNASPEELDAIGWLVNLPPEKLRVVLRRLREDGVADMTDDDIDHLVTIQEAKQDVT